MNNPTDNDTSVPTDPEARSATPASADVEMQRRFNKLQRELLDNRSAYIDRWLFVISIVLTFFAIVVAVLGYIGFKEFQEIENRANRSAEKAERLVEEIKGHRDEAKKMVKAIREINAQIAADDPEKAGQVVANVRKNPEASPIDKAIAQAVSLQQQGKRNDAIEKWRAVAHVTEGSNNELAARAWFSVGYLLQNENPGAGISAYDKALRLKPDFAAAYNNRGNAKNALKQYEAAIADYDQAIRLKPDFAAAYNNRGNAKNALKQYEAAIADYDQAIRLKPDLAEAYNNRGSAKARLGRYDEAIGDYNEAIRLKPDYAAAYNNRGNAKNALRQYDAALADYDEAIRLKPDYALAYYNRGVAKKALGAKDEARKDFETAVELAQKAGNANIVGQAEQSLRGLDADGGR